jgi:hypothetical protein
MIRRILEVLTDWAGNTAELAKFMRRAAYAFIMSMVLIVPANASEKKEAWWKQWNNFPNVPRITAEEVKELLLRGEKIALIYAGYKVSSVACGSYYLPYTSVPPNADGSSVKLIVPKNYWIVCYCP